MSLIIGLARASFFLSLAAYLFLAPVVPIPHLALAANGWPSGGVEFANLPQSGVETMTRLLVITIAALGLNLTLGYAGQISLAQAAFVGIGAYTTAIMTPHGVPFVVAFLASGLLCFIVGTVLGYPALRVQHHYLAFVTLAFTSLVFLVLRNEEWLTGGVYGISGTPRPDILGWSTKRPIDFYYFTLGIVCVLTFALWWLIRSPWGRAFMALRENPIRALSLGIDTRKYTLLAFAIGAAYGGFAGALYAPLVQFIEPSSFTLQLSLDLLLMVIVGGLGYFMGPFLGAIVAVVLQDRLRFIGGYYLMAYAILVMVLMVICPTGLLGLFDRLVIPKRSNAAPSNLAPVAAKS